MQNAQLLARVSIRASTYFHYSIIVQNLDQFLKHIINAVIVSVMLHENRDNIYKYQSLRIENSSS